MTRVVFSNYDDIRNPFYGGGGAVAIHEIARRLAARRDVTVITGKYPGGRNEVVDGVKYERIGSNQFGPQMGQVVFHFCLPLLVRRTEFDIWVENLTPPFSTACLQLFTKKPVAILTQLMAGEAMAKKYKLPFHVFERLGLKTYRYGIALTEPIRAQLLQANPAMRVEVIPNGVNPALINQPVKNEGEHVLFMGRISIEHKGLDLLLAAFASVAGDCGVPLVIAGSGLAKEEQALTKRVNELRLGGKIKLLGKITGEQKAEAFRRALFLVMPSRFEGFPLTLLEAFCWQLPVVLYSIPELAWLPDTCCVKVPPFDVPILADSMVALCRDRPKRETMGRAAKVWVREFSWDALAERYETFLASVLEQSKSEARRAKGEGA